MNTALFTLFAINSAYAWNWGSRSGNKQQEVGNLCVANKSSTFNQSDSTWGVCWEAMGYKRLDLSNVTAVFQPGFWERDYPEIMDFCSSRGNGTFCYRPNSQMNDSCLDMAVVRCPEGIISSCRSNFICNELLNQNVTCNSTVGAFFNTNYTESGQAKCQAIEDVIQLPPAQNVTSTIDQQNNTITVGSQVFGFPFATTTTVDCTFTCLTSLPAGFPQPSQPMTACFNESLPYDQWIPKATCVGPYPPGPMTTITETMCNSTSTTPMERTIPPTGVISSSIESSSSVMPTSEASQCPIGSSSSEMASSSYQPTITGPAEAPSSSSGPVGGYSSSMSEIYPSPCETSGEEMSSSAGYEPTSMPAYY